MAKTVLKYELTIKDVNYLEIPKGGEILSLQVQYNTPCIWVLVDADVEKETRRIGVIGSGHFIKQEKIEFIGTAQSFNGDLVWHFFEFFL